MYLRAPTMAVPTLTRVAPSSTATATLRKAQALRAHLAPREQMYLDAWVAEFDALDAALFDEADGGLEGLLWGYFV